MSPCCRIPFLYLFQAARKQNSPPCVRSLHFELRLQYQKHKPLFLFIFVRFSVGDRVLFSLRWPQTCYIMKICFDLILLLVSSSMQKTKRQAWVLLTAQLCSDLPVPSQCMFTRCGLKNNSAGESKGHHQAMYIRYKNSAQILYFLHTSSAIVRKRMEVIQVRKTWLKVSQNQYIKKNLAKKKATEILLMSQRHSHSSTVAEAFRRSQIYYSKKTQS